MKFFGPDGLNLSTEEERVEALLEARGGGGPLGAVRLWPRAEGEYEAVLLRCAPQAEPPGRLTVGRVYPLLSTEEG